MSFSLMPNGLALGEEADFEALNCLPALNLIQSTKLQLTTEPAFLPSTHVKAVNWLHKNQICFTCSLPMIYTH
jgi:hypothetical protein